MEEWKEVRLDSLVNRKICYGIVQPGFSPKNGIPVIKVNNVVKGLRDVSECDKTTEEISNSYKRTILKGGELIISLVGTVGCVDIAPSSFAGANLVRATGMIDIEDELIKHWVLYYIRTRQGQQYIEENLNTTVQRALNIKDLCKMPIPITSKHYMGRIVSILKSLDDKIEVNRKINENLEQQAQALFKSWFVDFEPFKDQPFVESELGMIPEGLSLNYISEIPHVLETGRRPKGGVGEIAQGIPSVGAEHVKGIGTYDYSKTKYITPEYASSLKTGKVEGYELLIYKDGGKPGYFIPNYSIFGEGYPFEECYLNEHVFKLDFDDKGYNAFCYFYFRTDYVMNYLNAQGGKAAIPGINKQDIENIPIYSQNNEIVKHFGDVVLPLIKQILFNCKESRRLAELRDTLLPKLMSGELKVNEVEI